MDDDDIQNLINYVDQKYEEECHDRVGVIGPCTAVIIFLIAVFIIAAILTCVFG